MLETSTNSETVGEKAAPGPITGTFLIKVDKLGMLELLANSETGKRGKAASGQPSYGRGLASLRLAAGL